MRNPISRVCLLLSLVLLPAGGAPAQDRTAQQTLLLRQPTVSDRHIAFVYAGDLWVTDRDGRDPRRLTGDPAEERRPHFSPDGRLVAFTAEYGGNTDVYVVPAAGGTPRRLTYHPGDDNVSGWSSDGERVTFSSAREVQLGRSGQLFEVSVDGGLPVKIMDAPFFRGDRNGERLAYMSYGPAYTGLYGGSSGWRGYRGGKAPDIRILRVGSGELSRVPGGRANDIEPRWDGESLYFLSDREGKVFNVFRYDRQSRRVRRLTDETIWDVRSFDIHDGVAVYEAGGRLKELNVASGRLRELVISLPADLPQTRPRWADASDTIETVAISTSGKRALITARGEVFTVPTKHGSTRNLTQSDGLRAYTALWSPDGERIAYIEDDGSRQALVVVDQAGFEERRRYPLGSHFYRLEAWGGDGSHIAYSDNRLNLHLLRLSDGRSRRVATSAYRDAFDVATSPDGRWLALTLERANLMQDLMLYEVASGRLTQVSDGMADVAEVAFSPDGKYLYFSASTNSGQTQVGLDLSSREQPLRLALYGVVLSTDGRSPLAPRTGDENAGEDAEDDDAAADDGQNGEGAGADAKAADEDDDTDAPAPVRIDLENIDRRIVALPVAARNYTDLSVEADGDLFYVDQVQPGASETPEGARAQAANRLMRFDFDKREAEEVAAGITAIELSHDGAYLLARNAKGELLGGRIRDAIELEKVDTSGMRVRVDPRVEWAQIFRDAWRMERDYFYAENLHGLDWQGIYERYLPLLDHVGRREDLNDLMVQMIAELQVGHNRVRGGDVYEPDAEAKAGLLGADLRIENGRYRIEKIYDGELWNPFLDAPLSRPGLDIEEGDYILAVNGRELTAKDNIFEALQGTVGKQTHLEVASTAAGDDARTVVVEPTDGERLLRLWDWVVANRRLVDEASGGRVGYVYLPNTAGAGYTFFNRMFFAQTDRLALIVDERSNGGGQAANYITDVLSRSYLASWKDRDGMIFNTPGGAIYGPKVMLIDQDAGSGGDFLPYAFRHMDIGTLIGTRTWGGLIGIAANPGLIDGGSLTVPFFRFFTPEGEWAIENEGVEPDIEVELDPVRFNRGEDVQLRRAIDEVLRQLEAYEPIRQRKAPPLPTRLGRSDHGH